jgi:hypothetical protein
MHQQQGACSSPWPLDRVRVSCRRWKLCTAAAAGLEQVPVTFSGGQDGSSSRRRRNRPCALAAAASSAAGCHGTLAAAAGQREVQQSAVAAVVAQQQGVGKPQRPADGDCTEHAARAGSGSSHSSRVAVPQQSSCNCCSGRMQERREAVVCYRICVV